MTNRTICILSDLLKWRWILTLSVLLSVFFIEGCEVLGGLITDAVLPGGPEEPILNVETDVATGGSTIENEETSAAVVVTPEVEEVIAEEAVVGVAAEAAVDTQIGDVIEAAEVVKSTITNNSFATIALGMFMAWMVPTPMRMISRWRHYKKTGEYK
jgi:hypothetical protein